MLEGTPYRISGYRTVDRTVAYHGHTFDVSQTLQSSADMNYFFAGYQYDVLSGPAARLGFSVGGAYLSATGTIQAVQTGITATKTETIGVPLAGADFRIFPVPERKFLEVDSEIRGMGVGSYGHYLEATGCGGVSFGHVIFLTGYRAVDLDFHSTSTNPSGLNARLRGPILSLRWRW